MTKRSKKNWVTRSKCTSRFSNFSSFNGAFDQLYPLACFYKLSISGCACTAKLNLVTCPAQSANHKWSDSFTQLNVSEFGFWDFSYISYHWKIFKAQKLSEFNIRELSVSKIAKFIWFQENLLSLFRYEDLSSMSLSQQLFAHLLFRCIKRLTHPNHIPC